MKETTYNKYKRERNQLKQLIDNDIQMFTLGQRDFTNRLNFLKKMSLLYRKELLDKQKKEQEAKG